MNEQQKAMLQGRVDRICVNCAYCRTAIHIDNPLKDGFQNECHKSPPFYPALEPTTRGYWPAVADTGWCGEWREISYEQNESREAPVAEEACERGVGCN